VIGRAVSSPDELARASETPGMKERLYISRGEENVKAITQGSDESPPSSSGHD
jgi:hypothetical protein